MKEMDMDSLTAAGWAGPVSQSALLRDRRVTSMPRKVLVDITVG